MTQAAEPPAAPPQYSPDGQWWWTGTEWVPAQPASGNWTAPSQAAPDAYGWSTPGAQAYSAPGYNTSGHGLAGYGVAGYGAPGVPVRTSGLAIAALILGLFWLLGLGSLLALIFGIIAINQINKSGGAISGRGMAIAGIVLGSIGLVLTVLGIIGAATSQNNNSAQAQQAQLKSDLRDTASMEETYFADNSTYADSISALSSNGLTLSPGDKIDVISATSNRYCLVGTRTDSNITWYYSNINGGLSTRRCA